MPIRVKGPTADRHPRRPWDSPERRRERQKEYMKKHGEPGPRRKTLGVTDKHKKAREQRKFSEAGFKPLRAAKATGGRIGLKSGKSPSPRVQRKGIGKPTPTQTIRDRLKDLTKKGRPSPGRPGGKGKESPDKRWNKGDKFMTPLRAKKAKGGRIGLKKGSVHTPGSHSWWLMNQSKPKRTKKAEGGRIGYQSGGRTRLLEELGRVEAEPSNRNRRAEVSRIHGELNKGYKDGGSPHTKDRQRPPRKKFIIGYGSKGTSRRPVEGIKRGYKSGGAVLKGKKVGVQIK